VPHPGAPGLSPPVSNRAFSTSWRRFPFGTFAASHVFAIGDIHGRADLLEALLERIEGVSDNYGVKRSIIFTGDYVDRGPESLRVLRLVMEHADVALPGNHEAMMLEGLQAADPRQMFQMWLRNGGAAVVAEVDPGLQMSPDGQRRRVLDALPKGFGARMLQSMSHHWDGDLLFVHGGLHPEIDRQTFLNQRLFGMGKPELHWAWIGEPFLIWTGGWTPKGKSLGPGPTVVVHGHTTCTSMLFRDEAATFTAMDRTRTHHRICLDVGPPRVSQLAALEVVGSLYRFHVVQA
jgi:serine/threonine protein phosphatase 1